MSRGLTRFEEQKCRLANVKVNKALGFMRDVASKILAHDAVPSRVVRLVELLLDVGCNVLLDVELLK